MPEASSEPLQSDERFVTHFTPEQRGWLTVALVAFLGIAIIGPGITRTRHRARVLRDDTARRLRALQETSRERMRQAVPSRWR